MAAFARQVCAATHAGDAVAESLVRGATRDAAATICALARDTATTQVVVVGRLGSDPVYAKRLAQDLQACGLHRIDAIGGPLDVDPAVLLSVPYATACLVTIPKPHQTASIWVNRHSTGST